MESQFAAASEKSNTSAAKTLETYKDIIPTLPQKKGSTIFQGDLYLYQGHWFSSYFLEGTMLAQDHYEAQPSEIVVAGAQKTGNTWLKALTFAIYTRTQFDDSTTPLRTKGNPHESVLLMEEVICHRKGVKPPLESLPLMSTHMPYISLPKSVIDKGCKIVYICREPKDTLVSLWHFSIKVRPDIQEFMAFEEFYECFCNGLCGYGPYWNHILGYWKASLERPEKVLFLKYEDVIRETLFYVKKIAEFMGCPFSPEEEKEGKVEEVAEFCSFESLRNLEVNKTGAYQLDHLRAENEFFFRRGKIGDWENYLTPEMAKRVDIMTEEKLGEYGFSFQCP